MYLSCCVKMAKNFDTIFSKGYDTSLVGFEL